MVLINDKIDMTKKKIMPEYTTNTQEKKNLFVERTTNVVNLILKLKEIISIASIVTLWLLALWLNARLVPFVQNDRDATFRIQAVESDIGVLKEDLKVISENVSNIKSDTQYIKGVLSQ